MSERIERRLTEAMLNDPYRNLPDPNRSVSVVIVGKWRISTITRADGSIFWVMATMPTRGRAGGTARIIYEEAI